MRTHLIAPLLLLYAGAAVAQTDPDDGGVDREATEADSASADGDTPAADEAAVAPRAQPLDLSSGAPEPAPARDSSPEADTGPTAKVVAPLDDAPSAPQLRIGGYAQPQFRLRQNDDVAQEDEDGFRLRRTRLTVAAVQPGDLISFYFALEAEFTPEFQLLDAVISGISDLPRGGRLKVDFGQIRPPMSQQLLISAAEMQFVDRAMLTEIAPARQLGAAFQVNVPEVPWIEVSAGVFNGEGRNQIQNIDEQFMYVGRVAIRPIGWFERVTESALGADQVSIAGSAAYLNSDIDSEGKTVWLGVDAFASWNGISGYFEYIWKSTEFDANVAQVDYKAKGLNIQAGYLLPIPGYLYRKLEVAARFEESDPNNAIPIEQPGDVNQSLRSYVFGVSYYHSGHDVKAQLAATHTTEVEDIDRGLMDATFDNDTLMLQVSYRLK